MWEKFDFGGIINNVQHRVAKSGKGWGFYLEGYDDEL
jgi:DNA polymerase-3 subunit alpha